MPKHPIIGLTTYGRNEKNAYTLPAEYIDAVRRAGGVPLLLPPGETNLVDVLPLLDGVILSGGGDIDPALYNGQQHPTIYMIDAERDTFEVELTKTVLAQQTPLLCICRGTQVLNVALGGTLIEHLPDVVGEDIPHRAPPRLPTSHPVVVEPESRLAEIMNQTQVTTASWHHQAVQGLAPGLRVVAHAPDGTIEALEMPGHPWLIAVQWHPELTAAKDTSQQRLFNALVEAAK